MGVGEGGGPLNLLENDRIARRRFGVKSSGVKNINALIFSSEVLRTIDFKPKCTLITQSILTGVYIRKKLSDK